jgi:hypothetical protein
MEKSYDEMLAEVKSLIWETIEVSQGDVKNFGLPESALKDIIYTYIMALGYNNENINDALNDLMPTRNLMVYPGSDDEAVNMAIHLSMVHNDYSHQIRAFKFFHQMSQEQKPYKEIIRSVKMNLLLA